MSTGAIEVTHRVGRLIETRILDVLSVEDVAGMRDRFLAIYATSPQSFLSAIDLRAAVTLGRSEIAGPLLQLFRESNARIERTGIVVGADALLPVQVEALVVNAHHPGRRVYRDAAAMVTFLGEVATDEERQRLEVFLSDLQPSGRESS
jgi:hypothetical protein